jgi:D-tagatose-1,6-bisphosphate aldolase subunit GatZ/KbaZ
VHPLSNLIESQKSGRAAGLVSICSAHPHVLRAAASLVKGSTAPLLVESTCNQVNQEGGYTGMIPAQFAASIRRVAAEHGLAPWQLILGGDHLGPYPWKAGPAGEAMDKGFNLVAGCVLAGYTKIHLDASMRCADDPPDPLPKELVARRAAELCRVAETAAQDRPPGSPLPYYVIGTEVPVPGGAQSEDDPLRVTSPEDALETVQLTRRAFLQAGLEAAWERTFALVVQPGVEFGDSAIHAYDRAAAQPLKELFGRKLSLVYEAHSTDYQTPGALRQLVEDHFGILKVGPALTYAFRQAVFALAWMEEEWLAGRPGSRLSRLVQTLERAMQADPRYWRDYYTGDLHFQGFARKYSLSDRSRYYWGDRRVQRALQRLLRNLEGQPLPLTLLSQFMPVQFEKIRLGRLGSHPLAWIDDAIQAVLLEYYQACGWDLVS